MWQRAGCCVAFAAAATCLLVLAVAGAAGQTVEGFYKGRQVRLIIHSTAGGDYDIWARLAGRYMMRYIPGNPVLVPQNMPGAGGITAANTLYSGVPRDGSVIGMIGRNLPFQALTRVANVKYDPTRFNWLGSPEFSAIVCAVNGDAPATSAADLLQREVLMGGAGAGTAVSLMPVFLSKLLGMRFKLVEGYAGASDVLLAMDRKEVHGVFLTISAVRNARGAALQSGAVKVLFNMEPEAVPDIKAPSIFEFARTDEQRRLLKLMSISNELGRPMLAPPEVPADRVAALREAFDKAMQDPELLAEVEKARLPMAVTRWDELTRLVGDLMATPRELVERMDELMR